MSQKTNELGLLSCSSPVPRLCPVPPWPCPVPPWSCQQNRGLGLVTAHLPHVQVCVCVTGSP